MFDLVKTCNCQYNTLNVLYDTSKVSFSMIFFLFSILFFSASIAFIPDIPNARSIKTAPPALYGEGTS